MVIDFGEYPAYLIHVLTTPDVPLKASRFDDACRERWPVLLPILSDNCLLPVERFPNDISCTDFLLAADKH